jgi:hypothetical protein
MSGASQKLYCLYNLYCVLPVFHRRESIFHQIVSIESIFSDS